MKSKRRLRQVNAKRARKATQMANPGCKSRYATKQDGPPFVHPDPDPNHPVLVAEREGRAPVAWRW